MSKCEASPSDTPSNEPVAWRWRLGSSMPWLYGDSKPFTLDESVWTIEPMFTGSATPSTDLKGIFALRDAAFKHSMEATAALAELETQSATAASDYDYAQGDDEGDATYALRIVDRCDQLERALANCTASATEPVNADEVRLLTAVLNQARETLLVSIKGTSEDLQRSLGKLNLACKAHWDWETGKIHRADSRSNK